MFIEDNLNWLFPLHASRYRIIEGFCKYYTDEHVKFNPELENTKNYLSVLQKLMPK